jgi:nitroreductase
VTILEKLFELRTPKAKFPVIDPIRNRFSPRVFSSEPVKTDHLNSIFEAARLAPSGKNIQPWFFYWARKGTNAYEKILSCVPELNYWAKSAPIIIVACCSLVEPIEKGQEVAPKNRWAKYDLGASVISLSLQAQSLGYYCRQMGYFDRKKVNKLLEIEAPLEAFTLIGLGKIGTEQDYKSADEIYMQKDLNPHERKADISRELV